MEEFALRNPSRKLLRPCIKSNATHIHITQRGTGLITSYVISFKEVVRLVSIKVEAV
jgi:hypothetical protein